MSFCEETESKKIKEIKLSFLPKSPQKETFG